MKIITLLTDFGLKDGYVGVMKGVIYQIAPDAQIADITHTVQPQNTREGCLTLGRSYRYFPAGSVHVAVVDPGVGTHRRPIAARLGDHLFVCPDNGLITLPLQAAEQTGQAIQIVHLDQPRFWLPQVSHVFHGRDIFAPAAAHLVNGIPLNEVGSSVQDPVRVQMPEPRPTANGWRGEIVFIDIFGNLGTNLTHAHLKDSAAITVKAAGQVVSGLSNTFSAGKAGQMIALIGPDEELTLSVFQDSAARLFSARIGDPVEVEFAQA